MDIENDTVEAAAIEISITHYKAVREEIVARMEMRQMVFVLYLGFVGAIFSLSATDSNRRVVAIVVPFISFGVIWIVRDHELGLALLGAWLRNEYQSYLNTQQSFSHLPQWDGSLLRFKYGKNVLRSRFMGYLVVLIGPSIASLITFWRSVTLPTKIVSMAFALASLLLVYSTYKKRQSIESVV